MEAKSLDQFVKDWTGTGREEQDARTFWIELLNILGISDLKHTVEFERRTAGNGRIDALFPDARLLVEMKSHGVDLDKPELRQGTPVTPVQQALRYVNALPPSVKPSIICTCNFDTFRFYDLEQDPLAQRDPVEQFTLQQLQGHIKVLERIFGEKNSRLAIEQKLSETAGLMVAHLHDALAKHASVATCGRWLISEYR